MKRDVSGRSRRDREPAFTGATHVPESSSASGQNAPGTPLAPPRGMTATMIQCLLMARDHGVVCGGWNPGAGARLVAASALLALERRGLLRGHNHASGATYAITAAGVEVLSSLELP